MSGDDATRRTLPKSSDDMAQMALRPSATEANADERDRQLESPRVERMKTHAESRSHRPSGSGSSTRSVRSRALRAARLASAHANEENGGRTLEEDTPEVQRLHESSNQRLPSLREDRQPLTKNVMKQKLAQTATHSGVSV